MYISLSTFRGSFHWLQQSLGEGGGGEGGSSRMRPDRLPRPPCNRRASVGPDPARRKDFRYRNTYRPPISAAWVSQPRSSAGAIRCDADRGLDGTIVGILGGPILVPSPDEPRRHCLAHLRFSFDLVHSSFRPIRDQCTSINVKPITTSHMKITRYPADHQGTVHRAAD